MGFFTETEMKNLLHKQKFMSVNFVATILLIILVINALSLSRISKEEAAELKGRVAKSETE
jgi:hypothetical protein